MTHSQPPPRRVPEEKSEPMTRKQFAKLLYDTSAGCAQGRAVSAYSEVVRDLAAARAENAENAEMRRLLTADELSLVADVLEAECGLSEDDYVMPSALAIERLAIRVRAAAEKAGGRCGTS